MAVPEAIALVADLCLDYDISDLVLWNNILTELVKLGQYPALARILVTVWQLSFYRPIFHSYNN